MNAACISEGITRSVRNRTRATLNSLNLQLHPQPGNRDETGQADHELVMNSSKLVDEY